MDDDVEDPQSESSRAGKQAGVVAALVSRITSHTDSPAMQLSIALLC